MALFKIFKGQAENLPKGCNDGYCYVTIDEGKMYIDTTNDISGRIVLNAEKADKDANGRQINRFYEAVVPHGTVIPSNANLNTTNFLTVGSYACSSASTANTLSNCPTKSAFTMLVYSPVSTTVDNEATATNVHRLRKLTTEEGREYYQFVSSGSTANSFTYGPWRDKLDSQGTITLTGDITGTASLSNGISITTDIAASGVTAGKYGPSANASPAHGKTFVVPEFQVAADGRITSATTRTITLPSDNNITSELSAESGNIIQLKESNNTTYKVTLVAGNDIALSTNTTTDEITIAHETFTTSKTTSTATDTAPSHGGSFTVVDTIATDNGHITGYTTKSIKLPSDNNTTSALSAEYNSTDKKHQIRLTESSGTTYNVELIPGNDITLSTDPSTDAITITHQTFTSPESTSAATDKTPAHGGSFKVIDGITTDNGHITGFTTKSVKLPSDNNTTYAIKASNNVITLDGSSGTDTTVTIAAGNDIGVSTGASDNKITIKHADFTTSSSTSTATDKTPAHGESFSVVDGITTDNGHITGYTLKSVKLPTDNNTTSSLSAEYNTTDKKHQIRLTESSGTTYNVQLVPGNDITMTTDTTADSITITHEAFTTTGSTSAATDKSPAHGGSFTVIDGITTDNGHVTGYTTKSVKLPADNNTTYTLDLDSTSKVTLNASSGTDTNITFAAGNDLVITPDTTNKTITYKHQDFTTTKNATNATVAPGHGGTVEVLGSITVDNGHITGYQNKTITLPSDNNTTYTLSGGTGNKIVLTGTNGTTTDVTIANGKQIAVSQSGNNITVAHGTVTTTKGTDTTAAPSHGTSFTVLDSITTDNGHVTGYVQKTVTLPGDNNTDTKVGQYAKSDNVNYPLLGAYAAAPTSGTASTVVYDTGMHMNPSTNTITATTFAGALSGNATTATNVAWSGVTSKPSYYDAKAITSITRSGTTFTYTCMDGTTGTFTQQDNNTTYSAGTGISLSGTTFSNSGVRSIATGSSNGTISVNTNGTSANVAVKGLGSNAYTSTAYLPLAGGTMTGKIARSNQAGTTGQGWEGCILSAENVSSYTGIYCGNGDAPANALGTSGVANLFIKSWYGVGFVDGCTGKGMTVGIDCRSGTIYSNKTYGAVWNDYAEFRAQKEEIKPGYCVASADNGQVYKTTEKFQACDGIVSDTFGFAIGETDECKTPLAVAGRVLAYCEGDRYSYHSGDTVCAGPDGKVVKMTREEIREWPDRIIGIVSEIPDYETWSADNVAVDGRIWIKVK